LANWSFGKTSLDKLVIWQNVIRQTGIYMSINLQKVTFMEEPFFLPEVDMFLGNNFKESIYILSPIRQINFPGISPFR